MTENKIIFEYLRNQQKSAEIEAKVNGINLWVLVGAIAVIFWKLIDLFDIAMMIQPELILRFLIGAEAIYLILIFCSITYYWRNDLRYNKILLNEINSPLLFIVEGLLVLLPPLLFLLFVKIEINICIFLFFPIILIFGGIGAIYSLLKEPEKGADRFPKLDFTSSYQTDFIIRFILISVSAFVSVSQGISIAHNITVTTNVLKYYALLVSFYILVLAAIERHLKSQKIQWTYEIETDLLVGAISSAVAIRRIENHQLGPKLEDVMNTFFDDIDKKIELLQESISECQLPLENIKKIPQEYKVERKDRVNEATKGVRKNLDVLQSDISDFSNYIEKLKKFKYNKRFSLAIENLANKRDTYKNDINELKTAFDISVQKALEEVAQID